MNEVRRYVPRNLRDDGMIEAHEVAHYTHLNLSQYVSASDYAALAARVQAVEEINRLAALNLTDLEQRLTQAFADRADMTRERDEQIEKLREISAVHGPALMQINDLTHKLAEAQRSKNQCVIELYQKLDKFDGLNDELREERDSLRASCHTFEQQLAEAQGKLAIAQDWNGRAYKEYEAEMKGVLSKLTQAEQQVARLREALRFYADPHSYGISGGTNERIIQDHGQQAKHALRETGDDQAQRALKGA